MSATANIPSSQDSDVDWLEMACNCKGLIEASSLAEIYSKTGLDIPDFVIKPTANMVMIRHYRHYLLLSN